MCCVRTQTILKKKVVCLMTTKERDSLDYCVDVAVSELTDL